jgi:hypothetical protein
MSYNLVTVLNDAKVEYSPADHNLEYVRNLVHQRENPDPFVAMGLLGVIVITMYLIYIICIKRNITGIWFGSFGSLPLAIKYKVNHNLFTDTLTIKMNNGNIKNGKIIGNTIYLYDGVGNELVGVLIKNNKIVWVDSKDVWNHVKVLS